jgi:hypothetical protein
MAFWWVLGGVVVLVGAAVLRDKSTRHKVIRAMARSWDRRGGKGGKSKAKARRHLRASKASAKSLPQVKPRHERPSRPKLLATKCSAACRTSRKPAFDKNGQLKCDCPCGGREHGMYRKGSTSGPKTQKQAAGSSGVKKAAAAPSGKPSTPKAAPVPHSSGPTRRATTGTLEKPKPPPAQQVRGDARPEPPKQWNGLHVASWSAMKSHADASPQCAKGTFSAQTIRDRRTDPPRVSQRMSCDTCGKGI